MRVLILSITAGEGHNSTAKAIRDELIARGVECEFLDTYGYINRALRSVISNGYLFFSSKTKRLYAKGYRHCEKRKKSGRFSVSRAFHKSLAKKLFKYIKEYDPDVIVYTHIFAGMLVDILKSRPDFRAKSVGIVTDFVFHPYWEEAPNTDKVVIANDLLSMQAKVRGYSDDQIAPIGIPIRSKFATSTEKSDARDQLGIDKDKLTVLIMGGSMGYGNLAGVVKKLDAIELDFQMLVVCGNNADAKASIEKLSLQKKAFIYGFVNNVDVMMDASDCIVSKPGGLTTSEALAKRLPMIIVNPIPGQEDRNKDFLLNSGVAMAVTETCGLEEIIFQLFSNPDHIELMRKNIDHIKHPNSTDDLCKLIIDLCND